MAFNVYLKIDGITLPQPDSYDVEEKDIEAESSGETEAGTKQRDVLRNGVHSISVAFSVSAKWLRILNGFKKENSLMVEFFDPETTMLQPAQMYIESFQASLVKDTSKKGLWNVQMTLEEF